MSISTFFEKLLGLEQQKAQATTAGYRELVAGIATGEEPDHAEVERLLAPAARGSGGRGAAGTSAARSSRGPAGPRPSSP